MSRQSVHQLSMSVRRAMEQAEIGEAATEARLLVEHCLGRSHAWIISHGDEIVDDASARKLAAAVKERLSGKPVFRVIGKRPFFGLDFTVTEDVLDPRPDTETLVSSVLSYFSGFEGPLSIVDLGTGSGAIAVSLLANLPQAHCLGVDVSRNALDVAQSNAQRNGLADRFTVLQGSWFEGMTKRFDCIVSNPPYVESATIALLDREVRCHDPAVALDGGCDGLDAYRAILRDAAAHLAEGGIVALEAGAGQAHGILAIARESGLRPVSSHFDIHGVERALLFAAG